MQWFKFAVFVLLLAGVLRLLFSIRRVGPTVRPEGRAYLRVRRAYEKAGYDTRVHDGPLAFAQRMRALDAPGAEHVQRVVAIYLKARFSAQVTGPAERRALQESVQAALRALRRRPADRSKRAAAA